MHIAPLIILTRTKTSTVQTYGSFLLLTCRLIQFPSLSSLFHIADCNYRFARLGSKIFSFFSFFLFFLSFFHEDNIDLTVSPKCIEQTLELYNMSKAKAAPTTRTTNIPTKQNLDEPLSTNEHKKYQTDVDKLFWLALIRPNLSYAIKELSRDDSTNQS